MLFSFKALDAAGFEQRGEIEAGSRTEALQVLADRSLTPLDLNQSRTAAAAPRRGSSAVRGADTVALIRELATLAASGVSLAEALSTLREALVHPGLQAEVGSLLTAIHGGQKFSAALRQTQLSLPPFVFALVEAGEATGDLGGAMTRAAEQMEFEARMRAEAFEALIYPMILVLTGVGAIFFIFSFVVPRFVTLLQGRTESLPAISSWVLQIGVFVNQHVWAFLIGMAALAVAGVLLARAPALRMRAMETLSRLPGLSSWLASGETARWTATLAVLIQSRVPILTALELTASSVTLNENARRLRELQADVKRGKRLSASVEHHRLLDGSSLTMLKVGEHSGEIGKMLTHVSGYWLERHRSMQKRLVALIEPLSIVVIGGVIGVVMVAVILAITSLTEVKL
jgi:general secretion pathway protein F